MTQLFADAARAELAATINSSDTTITIVSGGSKFPVANTGGSAIGPGADWFKLVLEDASGIEIVYVRTHTTGSNTFSNVIRGQDGSTAREFLAPAIVGLRPTHRDAADWESKQDSVDTSATGDFTAEANQSYWLRDSFQVTLPNTAEVVIGDRVGFSKALEATPTILASAGTEIVTEKGASESVVFDVNAEITFVFNGTDWEL